MRVAVFGLLLFGMIIFLGLTAVITAPYYYYHQAIYNNYQGEWFSLSKYRDLLLNSSEKSTLKPESDVNTKLWKSFQFGNAKIPLPVKNPFYSFKPIISYSQSKNLSQLGLELSQPNGLVLSRLIFLTPSRLTKEFRNQKLFKLPISMKIIREYDGEKLWRDIFTKDITSWNIPFEHMIHNLYILQQRTMLIPAKATSFGLLENGMAKITLESKDRDMETNLIYKYSNGRIYGLIIQWRTGNVEAEKFYTKLLKDLKFQVSAPALTSFIYKEFHRFSFQTQFL